MKNDSTQSKTQNEAKYNKWSQTLEQFVQSYIVNRQAFTEEESNRIIFSFVDVLGDIPTDALAEAKVKDTWSEQRFHLNLDGLTVLMSSKRTNTGFNIGFEPRGFYFEVWPTHLSNLRFMGDDFWNTFIGFCNQENFELMMNERPSNKEAAKKLANNKSKLFSLLRDYILFELEYLEFGTPAFAIWKFRWPFDIAWEVLQRELPVIFKAVWKLDYALWKVSYQKANKLKNHV